MKGLFLTIFTLCGLYVPLYTFAAYSVTPRVLDFEVEPRDIINETITITNSGDTSVRIFPTVNVITVGKDGEVLAFTQPSASDNSLTASSWFQIKRSRVAIPGGETVTLPLTIKIDPRAQAGEYHVFVGMPQGSNRPRAEQEIQSGTAPGVVVRIAIADESVTLLRLAQFVIDRFHFNKESLVASVSLSNPGTNVISPRGEVIFYNANGTEVASSPINTGNETIEVGEAKTFAVSVPVDLKLGKYKAFMAIEYGDSQIAQLQDTSFFYVIPLYQMIIFIVAFLLVTGWLAYRLQRHNQVLEYDDSDGVSSLPMYIRNTVSEDQDHDVKLSKKNE